MICESAYLDGIQEVMRKPKIRLNALIVLVIRVTLNVPAFEGRIIMHDIARVIRSHIL